MFETRFLSDVAREEYNRVAAMLLAEGKWSDSFAATLAIYAQAFADWVEATEELKKTSKVILHNDRPIQNPWHAVSKTAHEQMIRAAAEMGLTLTSFARADRTFGTEMPDEEYERMLAD